MTRRIRRSRSWPTLVIIALLVPVLAGATRWHNHLVKSSPATDEVLTASPDSIRLWFAERAIPRLSGIALWTVGPDSTRRPMGPVVGTDTVVSVAAAVPDPLPAGAYRIRWRTASEDGHVIRGHIDFTVTP